MNDEPQPTTPDPLPKLIEALVKIRTTALDHPCCDPIMFEKRAIDELCDIGGEVCDWTMIAIDADDALKLVGKGI